MKRYLLFAGILTDDRGAVGWHTFKHDFSSAMDAVLTARALSYVWWQVVDSETREIVEEATA